MTSISTPLGLVVLISGRGSNLEALLKAIEKGTLNAKIKAVISNRAEAKGLILARMQGIPAHVLSHRNYASRELFDAALAECVASYIPDLVVLAGFMRVLTEGFVKCFFPRLINIHPSLLPAFTGLHTHERAIEEGVKLHGCTVHAVTPELDHGPILGQGVVPVFSTDEPDMLANRVLHVEHQLLPAVVQAVVEQRWIPDEQGWVYRGTPQVQSVSPNGFWNVG